MEERPMTVRTAHVMPEAAPDPRHLPRTFAELSEVLRVLGFAFGVPPWLPPTAAAIDRRACRLMRCPACRRRGLQYRPYHEPAVLRYRVVAVCPECQAAEEV